MFSCLSVLALFALKEGARAVDTFSFKSDAEIAQSGWPFLSDYRDPSAAWDAWARARFFALYSGFWASVVFLVFVKSRWAMWQVTFAAKRRQKSSPLSASVDAEAGLAQAFGPKPDYPSHKLVHELFLQRAEGLQADALIEPGEPGLRSESRRMTYQELQAAVLDLADALRGLGVKPGEIVALCLQRSRSQVIAIFGALAAGGGYLPMDANAPSSRKRAMLQDSEALLVISEKSQQDIGELAIELGLTYVAMQPTAASCFKIVHESPLDRLKNHAEPLRPSMSDLAMLIYTSGTSGAPKGIIYDHQHLLHGAWFWAQEHRIDEKSVQLLKSPYFWAVMEWEIFPALIRGGSLVVASDDGHKQPEYLTEIIRDFSVDVLMITPSVLDLLLDVHEMQKLQAPLQGLKHITTVGEPLPSSVANRAMVMLNLHATLRNFYGASESSCTIYEVPSCGVDLKAFPGKVPAGQPQPHADVYVMAVGERPFRVVAAGEPGEICFGGVLAKGYHRLPELTDTKFVSTEHGRLYVTGDLGRWTNGVLEVIGRIDRQVKVNGVRVEPEEVEAVLCDFHMPVEAEVNNYDSPAKGPLLRRVHLEGDLDNMAVNDRAVARAAVVTTSEPAQLVAFVELREGHYVEPQDLQAHCRANLAPAYVPKYVVVQPGLPSLPNGKLDYPALRVLADEHALQTTETVLDSLGQMRAMSKWAVLENEVIHRCYAFWMAGVLLDHYALCAMTPDPNDPMKMNTQPFCTALAGASVAPWSEALIRSIGNDQDLFGFIMLGAYQDSRPSAPNETKKKLRLSWSDLYILFIYLFIAMPLPQICSFLTGNWAYPDRTWQSSVGTETSGWDQNYMKGADATSGQRWYLLMVMQSKLYVVLCDAVRIPAWLQVAFAAWCSYCGPAYSGNFCSEHVSPVLQFGLTWLLDSCFVWIRWVEWYGVFYVFCLHYLRPIVQWMSKRLPHGPVWAAAASACSMWLGMAMALYHYPNVMLETGGDSKLALLELLVTALQPALFALGTTYWSLDASWWGNTTLGCYVIHFVFRDRMTELFQVLSRLLTWDSSGLLLPVAALASCLAFTSTVGPLGHYVLILPQLAFGYLRQRPRHAPPAKRARSMDWEATLSRE